MSIDSINQNMTRKMVKFQIYESGCINKKNIILSIKKIAI